MPLPENDPVRFTYADYLTWPADERWEVVGGEAWAMTPAPTLAHQRVAGRLFAALDRALAGRRCVATIAPADVVLAEDTVVQPDVFVVCDPSKLRGTHVAGAPDLVIEVLSPATSLRDRRTKRALYERFGVREYVLVDPEGRYAERFVRGDDGAFGRGEIFGPGDDLPLTSLEGISLAVAEFCIPDPPATSIPSA